MVLALSHLLLLAAALGLVGLVIQSALTRQHARRPPEEPRSLPAVSILKPLCGVDDELEQNLEGFSALDYPDYEVVLGVKSEADPAWPVAQRAVARWPQKMRLVVQRGEPGLNPKVNQLITLEKAARGEVLVISDSNARVAPSYLRDLLACLEGPRVGVATHPLIGKGEDALGSLFDNLHLSTLVGPGMIAAARATGQGIVVGKSMALRRSDLAAIGGFLAMKDCLAEDYFIGKRITEQLGQRVAVARGVVINVSQRRSVYDFLNRYHRWSVIQTSSLPRSTYLAQQLLNPIPLALLGAAVHPTPLTLAATLAVVVLKVAIDVTTARVLSRGTSLGVALAAVPLKDLLLFGVWLNAMFRTSVEWRGTRLQVGPGSLLSPALPAAAVHPPLSPAAGARAPRGPGRA